MILLRLRSMGGICGLALASLVATSIQAQGPADSPANLPSQAKPVKGVVMPVPKEVFRSLDEFKDVNWRGVQRPEVAHWKSQGNQAQIALLLGVAIAEGFVAMEAKDSVEVKSVGNSVLRLARAVGVEKSALRRSKSIMDDADKNDWAAAREEWDGVLSDLENAMNELKSEDLAQLVSLGGWLRGTEALCSLVLQRYSTERAQLLQQGPLIEQLEKQLSDIRGHIRPRRTTVKLTEGMSKIRSLVASGSEDGTLSQNTVKEIGSVCHDLVQLTSQRQR